MQPFTVTEGNITVSLHHYQKEKVKKNTPKQPNLADENQTNYHLKYTCIEQTTNFILFPLQPLF